MNRTENVLVEDPPIKPVDEVDQELLDLLARWEAEDATTDPEELRRAEVELAEFKRAMNETRAAVGARLLFP